MNESSLSEQNQFKKDDTTNVTIQLTWGSPVKISRNISICRVTWGKSPSLSLGELNVNFSKGLHTVQYLLAVPQTLATRGSDKSRQNTSHRMIPYPYFQSLKTFSTESTSRILEDFCQWKRRVSNRSRNRVYFPNKQQDSPAWVCLSEYYKSKDHNSSSPVEYSTILSKLLWSLDPTRYQFNFIFSRICYEAWNSTR